MVQENTNVNDPRFIAGNILCQRLTSELDKHTVQVKTESALLVAQLELKCASNFQSESSMLSMSALQDQNRVVSLALVGQAAAAQLERLRRGPLLLAQLDEPENEEEEEVEKEEKLAYFLLKTKDFFLLFSASTFGHTSFKEASKLSRYKLRTALLYHARVLETSKQFSELDDEIAKGMNAVIKAMAI